MVFEKSSRLRHRAIGDGEDGNAEMGDGVEELEAQIRNFHRAVAVQDFLQHLDVGSGRGRLFADQALEKSLAGEPLRALLARRIHEDVRVDQDHA